MLEIREMHPADINAAAKIEKENFSRPWTIEGFRDALASERAVYLTALWEKTVVGYIGMWCVLDEGEITNVSVSKAFQSQGIGRRLLEELLQYGKKAGVSSYFLEVRESSQKARALYQSCGFEETGIRRNFYEAPVENGVAMCKR